MEKVAFRPLVDKKNIFFVDLFPFFHFICDIYYVNKLFFRAHAAVAGFCRNAVSVVSGGSECIVCGDSAGAVSVCNECVKNHFSVGQIDSGVCRFCGKQLVSEDDTCMECRNDVLLKHLDGVFPMFSYRLWNTNLLCRWKMEGERVFSSFFAGLMSERLSQLEKLKGKFVVVPVPPRPGKIRKEGWDQVEEICSFLEFCYGFKIRRILERHINVEQKTLDRTQRMKIIGKAYSLKKNVTEVPEKVCLVDDVLTTGSTIESCAQALKSSGCEKVFAVTLFSVDR